MTAQAREATTAGGFLRSAPFDAASKTRERNGQNMKKSRVRKKPKGAASNGKRSTASKSKARSTATKVVLLSGGKPADREGRRRRARAGLHRGHAGLETRRRAASRRAHRPRRPPCAQGSEVEFALLWRRGRGLVPVIPGLRPLRQSDVLPRHVAATGPARRQQTQGGALHGHPRGRRSRRTRAPRGAWCRSGCADLN